MARNLMLVGAACACLVVSACDKADVASKAAPGLSPAVKAEIARLDAASVIPSELSAAGVTIENGAVAKKPSLQGSGSDLEITGVLKNASTKPIDGVNLTITFQSAEGLTLGGHNTQQFFQPALAAGKSQPVVLRAPAIGGTVDAATRVKIDVMNLVKSGQSPDGWKPLDPNNLPAPVVSKKAPVTLPAEAPPAT